jgi:hypothetical protein
MTPLGFSAAIQMEESYDIPRDRQSPELSAGNENGTDTHPGPAFEPPRYVTIGLSVKASNGSDRPSNFSQISLLQGPRIQSGSESTLFGA